MTIEDMIEQGGVLVVDPLRIIMRAIFDAIPTNIQLHGDQCVQIAYRELGNLSNMGIHLYSDSPMLGTMLGRCFVEHRLAEQNLSIPSYLFNDNTLSDRFAAYMKKDNQLFVKKNILLHGGSGVKLHTEPEFSDMEDGDCWQPFLCSVDDEGFQRDYRALVIDDNVEFLYCRRSALPLINPDTGEFLEYPPTPERYLTNISQEGSIIRLSPDDHPDVTAFVQQSKKDVDRCESTFRKIHAQTGWDGFAKIDIDVMTEGDKMFVSEVHVHPEMSEVPGSEAYIAHVCQHLRRICEQRSYGGILFFGKLVETYRTYQRMKSTDTPCIWMLNGFEVDNPS